MIVEYCTVKVKLKTMEILPCEKHRRKIWNNQIKYLNELIFAKTMRMKYQIKFAERKKQVFNCIQSLKQLNGV